MLARPPTAGSRRSTRTAAATAGAVLLTAALIAGCGKSSAPEAAVRPPSAAATATAPPASTSTDPAAATPPASGGTASAPAPAGKPTTTTAPAGGDPPASPGGSSRRSRAPAGVAPAHPVPAAFRPAPGAPSDEEVREELQQMAAVERRQHERELSAAAADLAGLLPWALEPKTGEHESVASVFTDYGLGLACGGLLARNQLGVAHKTAPCGTLVTFTYGGRSLTVPVIDRGPYIAGREWDLTGATAAALHFPGLGRIRWALAG